MPARFSTLLCALILVTSTINTAAAQSVEAEALWQEGRRLVKEGKMAEACAKLEASVHLDSTPGSLLVVGDCREQLNQLATAWSFFLKAVSASRSSGDVKRQAEAKKRADALAPRLAYLTISVPDLSKVTGLTIRRNGQPVDSLVWNTGVPVDAGAYEITGQAPGHEPWSTRVSITEEGQKASVEVPRFKQIEDLVSARPPDGNPPPVNAKLPPGDNARRPVHDDASPGTFTTLRKASLGAAAVGVAGIAVGVVFGLKSRDQRSQADELCPQAACNNQMAIELNNDAKSAALTSNIGFVVGGVAVAGAVALWFFGAPTAHGNGDVVSLVPTVGGDQVGVTLGGRF